MPLTSTFVPARTCAHPPHRGSPVPTASPKNLPSRNEFSLAFSKKHQPSQRRGVQVTKHVDPWPWAPFSISWGSPTPTPSCLADVLSYFLNFFRVNYRSTRLGQPSYRRFTEMVKNSSAPPLPRVWASFPEKSTFVSVLCFFPDPLLYVCTYIYIPIDSLEHRFILWVFLTLY